MHKGARVKNGLCVHSTSVINILDTFEASPRKVRRLNKKLITLKK